MSIPPTTDKKNMPNIMQFIEDSTLAFEGVRFDVRRREYVNDKGKTVRYDVVDHPGAVVILPIFDEYSIVMIRNQRIAVGEILWELPAGTLEPEEAPEVTAYRELIEETGYEAGEMESLTTFYSSPGISNEIMHVYVAKELNFVGQQLDGGEVIVPEIVAWSKVIEMIKSGEIKDGKTLTALLFYISM